MKRMVKKLSTVARINFLGIILATICYDPNQCSAGVLSSPSTPPPPPPSTVSYRDRTIGCMFSDVCPEDQVCFDDHAFGRCEQYDPKTETFTSDYIYELDRKTLQLLEKEWNRLNRQGYSWSHPYTQCILKVILNDRPRFVYDPQQCEQHLKPPSSFVDDFEQNNNRHASNFGQENGNPKQQQQPKLLDQVSSASVSKSDDDHDLLMNIEQTLSKYLVPTLQQNYDGPSPSALAAGTETAGPFRKPTIEKQQQQQHQHQNDLNKESLPLISLFPPPPPPSQPSVSPLSSSKKSSSPKNFVSSQPSDESIPTISKHIDLLQLFSELLNNVPVEKPQNDPNEDGHSWEISDLEKNRELFDYLQDMINNNGNYNNDVVDDDQQLGYGLSEYAGAKNSHNNYQNPVDNGGQTEEEQGNYIRKNLMKTIRVNDFPPDEIKDEFNDLDKQKLIKSLFQDSIENGDHYGDGHQQGKDQRQSPLMSITKIPEIRIIRDTEDTDKELDPFDLTLIETSSSASVDDLGDGHEGDEDVILVDLDEDETLSNDNRHKYSDRAEDLDLDYGDFSLLNQILNGKLIKDSLEGDDDHNDGGVADGVDGQANILASLIKETDEDVLGSTNNDDQNVDDDDDDDDRKEILIGDINYSNNYLIPNFYRNHRYDIKKPGPIFLEDYILENLSSKPDSDSDPPAMMNGMARSGGQSDNVLAKKDFSIRSQQPVAEGPVKMDSASKDQLIIRSADSGEKTDLEAIDSTHAYVVIDRMLGEEDSESFLQTIEQLFNLPRGTFSNLRKEDYQITFKVNPNYQELNASQVATRIEDSAKLIQDITGYVVKETGIGDKTKLPVVSAKLMQQSNDKILRMTLLVCTIILSIISGAFVLYLFRRNVKFREKIKGFMKLSEDWIKFDYQDLCRQRFRNKTDGGNKSAASDVDVEKKDRAGAMKNVVDNGQSGSQQGSNDNQGTNPPSRSSTSSYVEEPVSTNMDITTGHIILSYMEDHLKRKDRLDREWEALCSYEADPCSTNAALQNKNANKNRYPNVLPYDHSRVILNDGANSSNSDYINANTITDHDPRNPAYIATQGPLPNTKADFWQMIWEQGSVLIVMLTRLRENGLNMCDRYWPEEGSEVYGNFEVHLVSEHIWCDDYLVRSFYLKNLKTGETRTVTQFHYLSWPENGVPQSIKSLLDFRRKVNKSYKGRSCPIVVHCNDGVGRTGTYILIDMVLNRLAKGAKEIDLAASLEHIRDQRGGMVKTKQQFEFVLSAVADEVQAILKTLPN